jgi:hypothetical protein
MYLKVPATLGQPEQEPSRAELAQRELICRRDALLAARHRMELEETVARTERVLQAAMSDLAKCRTRLDRAEAALKAAKKRARAATKGPPTK